MEWKDVGKDRVITCDCGFTWRVALEGIRCADARALPYTCTCGRDITDAIPERKDEILESLKGPDAFKFRVDYRQPKTKK